MTSCPPPPEWQPAACAAEGTDCTQAYLSSKGLEGCCDGMICAPNGQNIPTCRKGSAEELTLWAECEKATLGVTSLAISDPLVTSAGTIQLDTVQLSAVDSGPNGCLYDSHWTLDQKAAGGTSCSLMLSAGPATGANGTLSVQYGLASLNGCASTTFTGSALTPSQVTGTVAFSGVTCALGGTTEAYCYAGTFEIAVSGTVQTGTGQQIQITNTPVRVVGTTCGGPLKATCPGP